MNITVLLVGIALAAKHALADGVMQRPYQYLNKGNLRHPGGYLHAGNHGLWTALILAPVGLSWLAIPEAIAHYAIDYAKVNLSKSRGWSAMIPLSQIGEGPRAEIVPVHLAIYSDKYFWALVADQAAHFACYAAIMACL